jgi:hypothetical protein
MPNDLQVFAATLGMTEALKRAFGLKDGSAVALGILVGVLLGTLHRAVELAPVDAAGWYQAVFFGLTNGLSAVGLYAVADKSVTKIAQGLAYRDPAKSG